MYFWAFNSKVENDKQFSFSLWDLLDLAYSKRIPLIIVLALALIISTAISFIMPNQYESRIVLFPSSSGSVSEALLSKSYSSKDLLKFGTEEEVEQFLQILKSDDIRNKVIEEFDLMNHYNIDKSGPYPRTRLYKKYENNVNIRRTEFNSIRITVLDETPEIAAELATSIADYGDSLISKIQKVRAIRAFKLVEKEYLETQRQLGFLHDSLKSLRSLGIFEYESQAEVLNQAYADALIKGNKQALDEIQKKLDILSRYGGIYSSLRNEVVYETERLGQLKIKYIESKLDAEQDLPHKYVVSQAEIPERKAYPIRWLIVSVSLIATFILAMLMLIVLETLKKKKFPRSRTTTISIRIPRLQPISITINYDNMEQFFRNKLLFQAINKWRIHLIIVFVISLGAGIFVSSPIVITPLFKSEAIVYPVNIFAYSEESHTEQMLQIMRSTDIKIRMLDAFRLDEHYRLKRNTPGFMAYFLNIYNNNVSINKTEYEAVVISVLDKNAELAKAMCDSIISLYNQKVTALLRAKQLENVVIFKKQMNEKKSEVDSLENLLKKWNQEFGIIDVRAQIWGISSFTGGGQNTKLMESLKEKGIDYKSADSLLTSSRKEYINFKGSYEKSLSEYQKEITYTQIISNPIVADKKAFPIRWIIITVTVLVTLILALIVISFIESSQRKKA
jgi:uncharacterized protein involved in exopolysaccharide biosynthesis